MCCAVLLITLGLATFVAACAQGDGPSENLPTRTQPADPAGRFQELERLRKAARFHVVYDMDFGFRDYRAQFAWLQDGNVVQWVESNTYKDALGGTASIDDGVGSGLTCGWVTKKGWDRAEVSCEGVPRGVDMRALDEQLNGLSGELGDALGEEVDFVGYRTVLGVEVECFTAIFGILVKDTRSICYSAEGLPLEIESVVGVGGTRAPIRLTAVEARSPPTEAELLAPIILDAPLGQDVTLREIPLHDLVLPSLPIVEEFFSEMGQCGCRHWSGALSIRRLRDPRQSRE